MKKIVNGEEITLTQAEADAIQAEWDANLAELEADKLTAIKEAQKEALRKEKLDSMLSVEFAEIDAAVTEADVNKVKL